MENEKQGSDDDNTAGPFKDLEDLGEINDFTQFSMAECCKCFVLNTYVLSE